MVSIAETEIDLFGPKMLSFDEIKKLSSFVNRSERNMMAFTQELQKHLDDYLKAGIGLFIIGRVAEAAEKLKKAPDSKEKFVYLGYALCHERMFDEAIQCLDKAEQMQADSLMVAFEKTAVLRKAGKLDAAEKELKGCNNFENVSAEYHYQLGRIMDAKGEYEQAIANYHLAVELDANHQQALFHLAYACDLRGDDEAAVDYYTQITKNSPVYVSALLNLAVLHEDRGEYEKASICVNNVLESHPNHRNIIVSERYRQFKSNDV